MRIETMSNIGLFLLVMGIMATIIGTFIIYLSLSDYSQCGISPFAGCVVSTQQYIRFLNMQSYGSSAFSYGLVSMIFGAIFYISAQVRKMGIAAKEVSANVPKT